MGIIENICVEKTQGNIEMFDIKCKHANGGEYSIWGNGTKIDAVYVGPLLKRLKYIRQVCKN